MQNGYRARQLSCRRPSVLIAHQLCVVKYRELEMIGEEEDNSGGVAPIQAPAKLTQARPTWDSFLSILVLITEVSELPERGIYTSPKMSPQCHVSLQLTYKIIIQFSILLEGMLGNSFERTTSDQSRVRITCSKRPLEAAAKNSRAAFTRRYRATESACLSSLLC